MQEIWFTFQNTKKLSLTLEPGLVSTVDVVTAVDVSLTILEGLWFIWCLDICEFCLEKKELSIYSMFSSIWRVFFCFCRNRQQWGTGCTCQLFHTCANAANCSVTRFIQAPLLTWACSAQFIMQFNWHLPYISGTICT